ncbi:aminoacyl-tRNA hydrolase [Calderihabitans maritimus]|uniref:Peptidyl-tRNA hydrolase n=1 Tax=Calderihabitans maritimus TaxID=1246530 RepID=A0A1Z5HQ51_9FIRM|nr:aminoacyl-tRNA hydrolase [Calderihabitans maritimus]GAW91662.1 peptidyl-tRNA hydrolase [Calderihabitans maritimus]
MKLIVGLGNPGVEYETTRHNVGFMVVDLLAEEIGAKIKQKKFNALVGEVFLGTEKVVLAKPQTFMNLSGEAVGPLVQAYCLEPSQVVVVYDDLDLEVGQLRIRGKGSAGGHKGMASVIRALGTDEIPRLRIGIGRPEDTKSVVDYVLSPFPEGEWSVMREVLPVAVEALKFLITEGDLEKAMSLYNHRKA